MITVIPQLKSPPRNFANHCDRVRSPIGVFLLLSLCFACAFAFAFSISGAERTRSLVPSSLNHSSRCRSRYYHNLLSKLTAASNRRQSRDRCASTPPPTPFPPFHHPPSPSNALAPIHPTTPTTTPPDRTLGVPPEQQPRPRHQ